MYDSWRLSTSFCLMSLTSFHIYRGYWIICSIKSHHLGRSLVRFVNGLLSHFTRRMEPLTYRCAHSGREKIYIILYIPHCNHKFYEFVWALTSEINIDVCYFFKLILCVTGAEYRTKLYQTEDYVCALKRSRWHIRSSAITLTSFRQAYIFLYGFNIGN